ncbi:SPOR domain-containing protein [Cognatitamlana onchidii]|uniref:SPOR domain-containing protein n=1 Tax=Cognatitamlana onchidii TaxID=2562860 RepID=UPI0010A6758F|nr:SPOR domain-containing protein [Algibacter onchidii]
MTSTNLRTAIFALLMLAIFSPNSYSQEGDLTINQSESISKLMTLKKDMYKNENDSNRYKIQIYSGGRTLAQEAKEAFSKHFPEWKPTIQYETPNFKIWAGNFRTRLEADRALKQIKKEFPSAFIFKPKKEKS